jgi:hypothetical protein
MPHPPKTPQMTIKISLLQFIIPPPNTKSVSAKKMPSTGKWTAKFSGISKMGFSWKL